MFSNQVFHYSRCIAPKRVTSWRGPSSRQFACGQHSSLRRNVAAVASRWQRIVSDLTSVRFELRSTAPETNALPLDQLAGFHGPNLSQHVVCSFKVDVGTVENWKYR